MKGKKSEELSKHETVIDAENISRDFLVGKNVIHALKDVSLQIKATDFLVVFGPSGCGKSTLLNIILGLDRPTKGSVSIRGSKIYNMDDDQRAAFRSKKIGMIYQMPYWIKSLNVIENVALPLIIEGKTEKYSLSQAKKILAELNISDLSKQLPSQLSGGQQQKAGVARALISNPWILMADEPTGNLDSKSGDEMMKLFRDLNEKHKRTIMLVTHNRNYWDLGTRRIEMKDGIIVKDSNHG